MIRPSLSIRGLLIAVGVAVFVLFGGLVVVVMTLEVRYARREAAERLVNLARATATTVEVTAESARKLLENFAPGGVEVLEDHGACDRWLGRAVDALPQFTNLVLVDSTGLAVCSQREDVVGEVSYGDRDWFRRTMDRRAFTVSAPILGRRFGVWSVAMAVPVEQGGGAPLGAAVLGVELRRFQDMLVAVGLPEGTFVTVLDVEWRVVARSADHDAWVGKTLPTEASPDSLRFEGGVVALGKTGGGAEALFASAPVPTTGWTVYAGVERAALYAPIRASFLRDAVVAFLGVALLGSLLFWVYLRIVLPLKLLIEGTQAAAAKGSVGVDGPAELREVAVEFNRTLDVLRKTEEHVAKLARVAEQLADAVMITDRHGTIEYVNPAFEQITGYRAAEALGRNPRMLRSGEQDRDLYERMWGTILQGLPFRAVMRNRNKSGAVYVEDKTITPLRGEDGRITHFVSTGRDITGIRETEARLRQAEKLEAVGQLAGGVAHDFNNMLTVIGGHAGLAEEFVSEQGAQHVHEILHGVEMAAALTRQLLTFSRRGVVQPRPVALADLVRDVTAFLNRVLPENVQVRTSVPDEPVVVSMDPTRGEQLLVNLALNARDAMAGGGVLTMTVDSRPPEDSTPPDRLTAWAVLEVADTGCGVPPELLTRIYDPFFTTKERGTGLGLATVHAIVEEAGGRIEIKSALDEGTTFRIFLPRIQREAEARGGHQRPKRSPREEDRVILVVEDSAVVLEIVEETLRSVGFRVLTAGSGEEALARVAECPDPVALLVTDFILPDTRGPDLAATLRERAPELRVVFISGYADVGFGPSGPPPLSSFIQKPFSPADLVAVVEALLEE